MRSEVQAVHDRQAGRAAEGPDDQVCKLSSIRLQRALEVCTDSCKGESDMACINRCGTRYLKELHSEFEGRLARYGKELEKLN